MLPERRKILVLLVLVTLFITYSAFLYVNPTSSGSNMSPAADKGKAVWQQYNCNACHQVYGLGGYLGPDLTNSYSFRGPDYIKVFLENGTGIMPDFHLGAEEISDLLAYLQYLDSSGNADPRSFKINSNGTITQ